MEETHEEYLAKRLDGSLERLAYATLPSEPKVDQKNEEKEPEDVINVKINEVSRRNHLFHKYPIQCQPQSCYIELDCRNGDVCADWNAEIGNGIPEYVWHGHVIRFAIPCLKNEVVNKLMHELTPLFQRIVEGYEKYWSGSNHVGKLTEDAQDAKDEVYNRLARDFDPTELLQVWDAGDWLNDSDLETITAETSDDELENMAKQFESEADSQEIVLTGTLSHLEYVRGRK